MKRLMSIALVLCLGLFIHTGCQKVAEKAPASANTMSAVIDSNVFTATGTSVNAYRSGSQLVLKGVTPQNVSITITLQNYNGFSGTTVMDNYACLAAIDSGTGAGPVTDLMNTGIVTITQAFPYINGTFYFLCSDSTVVSHGRFSVVTPSYQ